jgi:hypothetical protein
MYGIRETGAEAPPPVVELAAPEDPALRALLAYWQGAHRADGGLPGRADIDPTALPHLLASLFLVDVEAGAEAQARAIYRIRLMGSLHEQLCGGSFTGRTVDEAMGDGARYFRCNFDQVRQRRAPLSYRGKLVWWAARDWFDFESIQMPLATDGTRIDMILGAAVYSSNGRRWRA